MTSFSFPSWASLERFLGKEWLISKLDDILSILPYGHRQEERRRDLKNRRVEFEMFEELTECFLKNSNIHYLLFISKN